MTITKGQVVGNPKEAAELIAVLTKENERLRAALVVIKERCAGDALPNWDRSWATTQSRDFILNTADIALGNAS